MIYLDTSAALAQLLGEDRAPPAGLWAGELVSSRLIEYQLWLRVNARGLANSHGDSQGRQLASDRAGRGTTNVPGMPDAFAPKTDPRRAEELRFVRRIAALLDGERRQGRITSLVLVMAPRMLGLVRAALAAECRAAVALEILARLVDLDARALAQRLHGEIRPSLK